MSDSEAAPTHEELNFADSLLDTAACTLHTCSGLRVGAFEVEPCNRRLKGHGKGKVCVRCHDFVKCVSCDKHYHNGCWVECDNTLHCQVQKDKPFQCKTCIASIRQQAEAAAIVAIMKSPGMTAVYTATTSHY